MMMGESRQLSAEKSGLRIVIVEDEEELRC